jgi:sugar-phosphatase
VSEVSIVCQGLLFDMDGVLVDSLASVRRSWRRWAAEFGVTEAATLEIPHGTRAADIIQMLAPNANAKYALERIDELEAHDLEGIVALPGAAALLQSLPAKRWTIVTSATSLLLHARLRAAGLAAPVHLVTGSDVTKGKPDPEPYLRGAEMLGIAASQCVVFEDASNGVRAGLAAGCRVVGVLSTHSAEALRDVGAEFVVESLADVSVRLVEGALRISVNEAV